jgi:hypothetical protein
VKETNPYSPPAHDGAVEDEATRGVRIAGVISLALAGPLLIVGLVQIVVWADHLEDVSLLSGSPSERARNAELIVRAVALGRAGQAATLLHVLLGAALIPLGIGQLRGRRWARRATLGLAIVAVTMGAMLAVVLLRAGEPPGKVWLFQFAPALLVGATELFFSRRVKRKVSSIDEWERTTQSRRGKGGRQ